MKKVLSLVLALAIMLSVCSFALAEQEEDLKVIRMFGRSQNSSRNGVQFTTQDWIESGSYYYQELEKIYARYGFKFEYDLVPEDQIATVAQTRIATGLDADFVDMSTLDTATRVQLAERGMVVPIDEIIANYCSDEAKQWYYEGNGSAYARFYTLEDGHFYWITHNTASYDDYGGMMCTVIRGDWLDTLGMELPTNIDEFYDCLVAFQENDMNGNGVKDEVSYFYLDNPKTGIAQWFGLGTDVLAYIDLKTGKATSIWYEENFKVYMEYIQKLVKAGLVDTSNSRDAKNAANQLASICEWTTTNKAAAVTVGEGQPAPYYLPILVNALDGVAPQADKQSKVQLNNDCYMVTADADPEAISRLLNCIAGDELWLYEVGKIEGIHYEFAADGTIVEYDEETIDANEAAIPDPDSEFSCCALGRTNVAIENVDRIQELKNITKMKDGKDPEFDAGWDKQAEQGIKVYLAAEPAQHDVAGDLAVATEEELELISDIETDLKTAAKEILYKLNLGEYSVDDLDTYVQQLNDLGLEEYVAMVQARYDRAHAE